MKMEAAVFESTTADQADSWLGETRAYSNSYEQPVVIGQVMSSNSETPSMFWARGLSADEPPSATMLRVGRHAGEGETAVSGNETIGYIVIEQSVGSSEHCTTRPESDRRLCRLWRDRTDTFTHSV